MVLLAINKVTLNTMKQIILLLITLLFSSATLAEEAILYIRGLAEGATVYLDGEKIGKIDKKGRLIHKISTGRYHLRATKTGKVWDEVVDQRVVVTAPITNLSLIPLKVPLELSKFLDGYMTIIPGGIFEMGDLVGNGQDDEKPVHLVQVKPFRMGKTELPFSLYDQYLQATNQSPSEEKFGHANDHGWGREDRPAINISWDDAQAFITWLNKASQPEQPYRLPTEAEWEYAARAGTETDYWWGSEIGTNNANCPHCGSQWDDSKTAPVASFNPNPYGLYDTAGNVWEWVQDCYEASYNDAPSDSSAVAGRGCYRVIRGGSWYFGPRNVRVSNRNGYRANYRSNDLGFRLAQDL